MLTTNKAFSLILGLSLLAAACSIALPPQELVDAREAFAKAQKGQAAELAPAQLEDARQSLDRAEATYKGEGVKPETRDHAYIALRKIEIANAVAAVEAANRAKVKAQKDLEALRTRLQEQTQANLNKTTEQLEQEKRQRERDAERAAAERDKLKEGVAKTQAELEAERKRRVAAEGRLQAALSSLDQLAKVKEEKRGVVITLNGSVMFATGKADLLPIAQQKLDEVAKALKDQGYKKLVIEGHTDSRGPDRDNQELSQKRAEAVRNHLVSRGIDINKTEANGLGESRPVADNNTEEGRAANRRVEIVVTPES